MTTSYIWGTGKIAKYIYSTYKDKFNLFDVAGFIDNDLKKVGKTFFGKPIFHPSVLEQEKDCRIIILIWEYEDIIRQIKKDYSWIAGKIETPLLLTKYHLVTRYKNEKDEEIIKIIDYLKDHNLHIFNYDFIDKYDNMQCLIKYDKEAGLYYTFFNNKPMYFAKYLDTEEKISNYYKRIQIEQDIDSPHRYLTEDFTINPDSIIVDAGVAEGNFALSIVDKAKKLYLFEADSDWIEALQHTFASYKDKVVIVNRYLSDYTDKNVIALDDYILEEQVDFIKLDVEGEEYYALKGAENTILRSENIKCVVCTYHQEFDFIAISQLLNKYDMETKPSKGYMWFPYDKNLVYSLPTLRRGLVRGRKKIDKKGEL